MFRRTPVLLLALALVAGCSSGGDADDDGASLGDTAPLSEVTAPPAPETSAAGTGVVVIGGLTNPFSVTECVLEPAADDPTTLVLVTGAGMTVAVERLTQSTCTVSAIVQAFSRRAVPVALGRSDSA